MRPRRQYTIGPALRELRERCALEQQDVAQRLGVTQQQIAKYESPMANPQIETIERYVAALELGVAVALVFHPSPRFVVA